MFCAFLSVIFFSVNSSAIFGATKMSKYYQIVFFDLFTRDAPIRVFLPRSDPFLSRSRKIFYSVSLGRLIAASFEVKPPFCWYEFVHCCQLWYSSCISTSPIP